MGDEQNDVNGIERMDDSKSVARGNMPETSDYVPYESREQVQVE